MKTPQEVCRGEPKSLKVRGTRVVRVVAKESQENNSRGEKDYH
jgi:hypothetical protein